jgi:hypothetical protein
MPLVPVWQGHSEGMAGEGERGQDLAETVTSSREGQGLSSVTTCLVGKRPQGAAAEEEWPMLMVASPSALRTAV